MALSSVMAGTRVAVAMSGGVDSSVAAAVLKEAGHEVAGVAMRLWHGDSPGVHSVDPDLHHDQAIEDARRVCRHLDIPFTVADVAPEFRARVVDYFCQEYGRGRTPNPCIACNQWIKFGLLLDRALSTGADYLATGHYARIEKSGDSYCLLKGSDASIDQSYFLYTLGQPELAHLLFPVGGLAKAQVRRMAAERGLPVADKPESQDVCFVPDGNHDHVLEEYLSPEPGDIVDEAGNVLGRHRGIAFHTVGQRTGLGVSAGRRLYVLSIDAENNVLTVGPRHRLLVARLFASNVKFVSQVPGEGVAVKAKVRYRAREADAFLHPRRDGVEVQFLDPQSAVTPGQAVVFYRDAMLLGGGTIEAS